MEAEADPQIVIALPAQAGELEKSICVLRGQQGGAIASVEEHAAALERIKLGARVRKVVAALFDPVKSAAHKAHRDVCAAENRLLKPLDEGRKADEAAIGVFTMEAERRAREEQDRLNREVMKAAEERRLAAALEAENAGEHEQAEAIIAAPLPPVTAPVVVQPELAKVEGVSAPERWVHEILDFPALARMAVAKERFELLLPNDKELAAQARRLRSELRLDGVRAVRQTSTRVTV